MQSPVIFHLPILFPSPFLQLLSFLIRVAIYYHSLHVKEGPAIMPKTKHQRIMDLANCSNITNPTFQHQIFCNFKVLLPLRHDPAQQGSGFMVWHQFQKLN